MMRAPRKSIRIDLEAYELLCRARIHPRESLGEVIKRKIPPPFDFDGWLKRVAAHPMSREAIKAVEEQIRKRRPSSAKRKRSRQD